ncbi:SusC/RagA family TonB-linked outer membrane protein [Flammeovirga yaeyamensis]|uniref:SusC/RagA family TonB-linked outer membrane protein n=1 Tax=Flammeovirga yaeyamensis TaxID=367791 RepID=A0AAX1N8A0_9BACT|nr:TonB-dependent receptor [Flammeovirga yaeyamensis]MBB3701290.1 TonB-linked SusC/RagA family outer membrane protein [Flammeovirga yaeyamensis]NMF38240.1 TonB-dependent receptor [Flammeovirga yaeyamensis]QWG02651.1 SusC/RagA family TonB-linked outer membrane protein [Flammeovirga yaeyamensis]
MLKLILQKWHLTLAFMVLMLASTSAFAQSQISGTITSQTDNDPIPGVSIFIKGTTTGTISDFDGNYSIMASPEDILVYRYIGMEEQEIVVGTQTSINVALTESTEQLNEVVVVGYGTQKKSHLTGAISKVTNEKLDQLPVSRVDDALIGQVSGVNIQQTNPQAGEAPTIQVRGVGSIAAGSGPAIVVDGVLVEDDYMASLDMNDVASIEVLKDASSAAIFGSRGGNGVIMITTKSGQSGDTKFNFNTYYGRKWSYQRDNFRPTVAENKANIENYIANIDQNWPADLPTDQRDYVVGKANTTLTRMNYMQDILGDAPEKDWQDIIFEDGNIQSYSLAASGGSDNTTFNVSGAYLKDDGVLLADSYSKMNLRFKLKSKLTKRLELGLNVNPVREQKQVFPTSLHESLRQSTWLPIKHDEHTINFVDRANFPNVAVGDYAQESHFNNYPDPNDPTKVLPNVSVTNNSNPYANIVERDHKELTHRIYTGMYLKYKVMKGLNFRTSFTATYRDRVRNYYDGTKATRNGASDARLRNRTYRDFNWINDNYFTYNKNINGLHDINATLGMSFERRQSHFTETIGTGYTNDAVKTINAASVIAFGDEYIGVETLHSVFARVNYAYNDKYLFSVSMRTDGSSRFGQNYKYGIFPAGSFGWRITEENFMKGVDWVSVLKPRISYGITGNNQGIGLYDALGRMYPSSSVVNGSISSGYNPANIAQPDLRWEQQVELNPGLDWGLFGNRLFGSIEWYRRRSNDLLLTQQIPSVTGFDQRTVNLGQVQNQGWEFEINVKPIQTDKFKWTLTANASTNENKLLEFGGVDSLITIVDDKRPANWIATTGHPISSFYGYKIDRSKGDDGKVPFEYLNEGFWPIGGTSQMGYVQDLNGDGVIDENDRTIIGSPYPNFIWSVTNNFQIGRFDVMFMFQGSMGGQVLNIDPQYYEYQTMQGQRPNTQFFEDMPYVRERILTDDMVQDASFIALRNFNVGYSLPTNIAGKVGLNKARVYASGTNLLYIMSDGYTSFNPEGIRDEGPINYGYQRGSAPIPRSFILGINAEF